MRIEFTSIQAASFGRPAVISYLKTSPRKTWNRWTNGIYATSTFKNRDFFLSILKLKVHIWHLSRKKGLYTKLRSPRKNGPPSNFCKAFSKWLKTDAAYNKTHRFQHLITICYCFFGLMIFYCFKRNRYVCVYL